MSVLSPSKKGLSTFRVTLPLVPPPDKAVPAVTAVISPELLVHPESLLNLLNFNSPKAFLLSEPESNNITSSLVVISAVMSVNSERSRSISIVPELVIGEPDTSRPVPTVTATEVTLPPPLVTVCQVLSPLKNLVVIDEPLPNLAAATVPELILLPFKLVILAPVPLIAPPQVIAST